MLTKLSNSRLNDELHSSFGKLPIDKICDICNQIVYKNDVTDVTGLVTSPLHPNDPQTRIR